MLALLRQGVKGDEIAIVFRSLRHSAALLESVFAQYGIALRSNRRLPLTHPPLGRALRGAARCALLDEHQARPQDLLHYLRAPGVLERPEMRTASKPRSGVMAC